MYDYILNKIMLIVMVLLILLMGVYMVLCSFSGNIKIESEIVVFMVYNSLVIFLLSIFLSEIEISDFGVMINMMIIGINFVDIGYVVCVSEGGVKFVIGVFVSFMKVYCLIIIFKKFVFFNVFL